MLLDIVVSKLIKELSEAHAREIRLEDELKSEENFAATLIQDHNNMIEKLESKIRILEHSCS